MPENPTLQHQARIGMACPHCAGPTRTRSSRSVTPTYRQLNLVCIDPACGATFGAELAITHAISPSARPNPAVQLRMAPPRQRPVPANDTQPVALSRISGSEVPPAANENDLLGEAFG